MVGDVLRTPRQLSCVDDFPRDSERSGSISSWYCSLTSHAMFNMETDDAWLKVGLGGSITRGLV